MSEGSRKRKEWTAIGISGGLAVSVGARGAHLLNWGPMGIRNVCISDTHTRHGELAMPPGDVLVHAGDLTDVGAEEDVVDFDR